MRVIVVACCFSSRTITSWRTPSELPTIGAEQCLMLRASWILRIDDVGRCWRDTDKGNSSMKATGICLFLIAAVIYFQLLQDIWQLVAEAREAGSTVRFNRFWWTPAWGVHRAAFPSS